MEREYTNKIKIKDSLYILKETEDIYNVIFTGVRRIKKFKWLKF